MKQNIYENFPLEGDEGLKKVLMLILCIFLLSCTSCQKRTELSFPTPVRPETFVREEIVNREEYCEMKTLPWYTSREDVREVMKGYELYREDQWTDWYQMDSELEDGTPAQIQVSFGYGDTEKSYDMQPMSIMNLDIYIEESDGEKANGLAKEMLEILNQWAKEDGENSYTMELAENSMEFVKRSTNACLLVRCYPDASTSWRDVYPNSKFENYSMIRVELWPMNRWN